MAGNVLGNLLSGVVELAARKKKLMEDILLLTADQSGLLTPEKADELLALIERKQDCIEGINKIDAEVLLLEEKILNLAGISSWEEGKILCNEKWELIENLRLEIVLLLKETQRLDEQNRQRANGECRKIKKDMESLYSIKGSVKAYQGPAAQSGGYFIDKKK